MSAPVPTPTHERAAAIRSRLVKHSAGRYVLRAAAPDTAEYTIARRASGSWRVARRSAIGDRGLAIVATRAEACWILAEKSA